MKERLQAILEALEDNDNSAAYIIAKHALAAEEKRDPDAWISVNHQLPPMGELVLVALYDGDFSYDTAEHNGQRWDLHDEDVPFVMFWRSIAPPQVKSEPEKVAEEDAPQPGQPAGGAAQCPSCKSAIREMRSWVSARHGGEAPCWHSWHDSTPAALKLTLKPTAQYCTPRDK